MTKITPINRANITTLRNDATKALQDVLSKHGLKLTLGRITYTPGREFRCKMTIVQPATGTPSVPAVGETWKFGTKTYEITSVNKGVNIALGVRWSNTRVHGRIKRTYRINLMALTLSGIKLN